MKRNPEHFSPFQFYDVPKKIQSLDPTEKEGVEKIYHENMLRMLPRRMEQHNIDTQNLAPDSQGDMLEELRKNNELEIRSDAFQSEVTAKEEEMWEIATEQFRAQKELETDEKTGLLKEKAFESRYEKSLERLNESGDGNEVMVFIHFDLDYFRTINETIGHKGADGVLREMADQIKQSLRVYDVAARVGGDEFEVILNHVRKEDVDAIVERVLSKISSVVWNEETGEKVSVSAGVNVIGKGERPYFTKEQKMTDRAAYITKDSGRGGYTLVGKRRYSVRKVGKEGVYTEIDKGAFKETGKEVENIKHAIRVVMDSMSRSIRLIETYLKDEGKNLEEVVKERYAVEDITLLTIAQVAELFLEAKLHFKENGVEE